MGYKAILIHYTYCVINKCYPHGLLIVCSVCTVKNVVIIHSSRLVGQKHNSTAASILANHHHHVHANCKLNCKVDWSNFAFITLKDLTARRQHYVTVADIFLPRIKTGGKKCERDPPFSCFEHREDCLSST